MKVESPGLGQKMPPCRITHVWVSSSWSPLSSARLLWGSRPALVTLSSVCHYIVHCFYSTHISHENQLGEKFRNVPISRITHQPGNKHDEKAYSNLHVKTLAISPKITSSFLLFFLMLEAVWVRQWHSFSLWPLEIHGFPFSQFPWQCLYPNTFPSTYSIFWGLFLQALSHPSPHYLCPLSLCGLNSGSPWRKPLEFGKKIGG